MHDRKKRHVGGAAVKRFFGFCGELAQISIVLPRNDEACVAREAGIAGTLAWIAIQAVPKDIVV